MILATSVVVAACGNDPYPGADSGKKVVYLAFDSPPKTLDPQVAYTTTDHVVTGAVNDRLLEYDYLARPYRLIPGLVRSVPATSLAGRRPRQPRPGLTSRLGHRVGNGWGAGQEAAPCATAWMPACSCSLSSSACIAGLRSKTTRWTVPVKAYGALCS